MASRAKRNIGCFAADFRGKKVNDYIVAYKHTGDEQHLAHFLHAYESALNIRTENFCEHYGQLQHFQDINGGNRFAASRCSLLLRV
jgi:hypothetical protein